MARTACLVCLVVAVSGHCKHALGRGSASSKHTTKLEQSTFLRYLWLNRSLGFLFTQLRGDRAYFINNFAPVTIAKTL